ncbi:MAG: hypothetical protein AB2L14_36905 [Candidatus Xenobiia bacterium LiM19]
MRVAFIHPLIKHLGCPVGELSPFASPGKAGGSDSAGALQWWTGQSPEERNTHFSYPASRCTGTYHQSQDIVISLISTVVYGVLIYLVYHFCQSAISWLERPERLLTIVEVMITGGFLMGLAHTLKNSTEKPS